MIVVDTNVIAYLFITGKYTKFAEILLKKDSHWVAPRLWRSEFRNVLTLYIRQGSMKIDNARFLISEAEKLMAENEYEINSDKILEMVQVSNCSAYDCEFVALAHETNLPLYTTDRKLLNEFPKITTDLRTISQ